MGRVIENNLEKARRATLDNAASSRASASKWLTLASRGDHAHRDRNTALSPVRLPAKRPNSLADLATRLYGPRAADLRGKPWRPQAETSMSDLIWYQ